MVWLTNNSETMFDLSKIINKPKRKKQKKKSEKKSFKKNILKKNRQLIEKTKKFAKELQKNPPKSDLWFQKLWCEFKDLDDKYNEAFGHYIPDCINHKYKYIIEIDGSFHFKPDQIKKDIKKNEYYMNRGYDWYRIQAYNEDSLKNVLIKIETRRKRFNSYQDNSLKNKVLDNDFKVR